MQDEDEDSDGEFIGKDEADDETTLLAEEALPREETVEEEEEALKREADMDIEEIKEMYRKMEELASECEEESDRVSADDGVGDSDDDDNDDDMDLDDSDVVETNSNSNSNSNNNNSIAALHAADNVSRTKSVSRPFILNKKLTLRYYQHQGLQWLVSIQSRRLNGILADEMGLGKTVQTISCLAYLAAYKGIWGPHLIIVPTSCLVNWEMECKKFCPSLKVLTYYGSAKQRKELRTGWTKPNMFHICVTSYQVSE